MGLWIDEYNPTRDDQALGRGQTGRGHRRGYRQALLNRYYTLRLVPQPKMENGPLYWELLITRDPTFI